MPFELVDPWNPRQLGAVERATRHDDKTRLEDIVPISRDCPPLCFFIPSRFFDLGLETGLLVEIEVLADSLSVFKDLWPEGILLLRDVASLFEQRQIDVGLDITLRAGIAVPIPSPAKISGFLDDANVGDPHRLQPRCG